MGVEYRHYFVPSDPEWVAPPGTAVRVRDCFRRWGLIESAEDKVQLWDLKTTEALRCGLAEVESKGWNCPEKMDTVVTLRGQLRVGVDHAPPRRRLG